MVSNMSIGKQIVNRINTKHALILLFLVFVFDICIYDLLSFFCSFFPQDTCTLTIQTSKDMSQGQVIQILSEGTNEELFGLLEDYVKNNESSEWTYIQGVPGVSWTRIETEEPDAKIVVKVHPERERYIAFMRSPYGGKVTVSNDGRKEVYICRQDEASSVIYCHPFLKMRPNPIVLGVSYVVISVIVGLLIYLFSRNKNNVSINNIFVICMAVIIIVSLVNMFVGIEEQMNVFYQKGTVIFEDFGYWLTDGLNPYLWSEKMNLEPHTNRSYPPLALLLWYPFTLIRVPVKETILLVGLLIYTAFLFLGLILCYEHVEVSRTKKMFLAFTLFFSGAFWFSFERGNIIVVSSMLTLFFLFEYDSENKVVRELAFLALAVAAGIKLYPAIFGLILLDEKKYREAIRTILYGLVMFFVPFLFFKGGFRNIPIWINNLKAFNELYKYVSAPVFNYKLFAVNITSSGLRTIVYAIFPFIDKCLVLLAIVAFFLSKNKWKKVMLLSLSIIFFSNHSPFYEGLFFWAGIVFFLSYAEDSKINYFYLALIIALLNPLQICMGTETNYSVYITNLSATIFESALIIETFKQQFNKSQIRLKLSFRKNNTYMNKE